MSETNFIAEIQANPFSDQARLIYADWLDERGDIRGQFLRNEVDYTKLDLKSEPAKRLYDQLVDTVLVISPNWLTQVGYRYDFRILTAGQMWIEACKTVISMTGISLKQTKEAVRAAPMTLLYSIPFHATAEMNSSKWIPKSIRENYNQGFYKGRELPDFEFRLARAGDVGPLKKHWGSKQVNQKQ